MNALLEMSRAIRRVLNDCGDDLADIPIDELREMASILKAYAADLDGELERRDDH